MIKIKLIDKNEAIEYRLDIENILCVLDDEHYIDLTNNLINNLEQKKCICIVAFYDKKLIGILWAYKRLFGGNTRYHINYFAIKEKYRNKNIGSNMIDYLKEILKKENIEKIDLNVDFNNEKSKKFYKKNFFKEEKILMSLDIK